MVAIIWKPSSVTVQCRKRTCCFQIIFGGGTIIQYDEIYTQTSTTKTATDGDWPVLNEGVLDFSEEFDRITKIIQVFDDLNLTTAIILGLLGTVLFLSIVNPRLRSLSPMWYLYHIMVLSLVTALLFHPMAHAKLNVDDRNICYFLNYSLEFIFFALGMAVVLLNTEIFFTIVLPLPKWQVKPFFRFCIAILLGWNIVSVMAMYVTFNNNDGRMNQPPCFFISDAISEEIGLVLRSILPAALCVLFTVIIVATHYLKRTRQRITFPAGEWQSVATVATDGEVEWIRKAVFVNTVFIIRAVTAMVIMYDKDIHEKELVTVVIVWTIHMASLYLFPFGLLFLADGRAAMKAFIFKTIAFASCGKARFGVDVKLLAVRQNPQQTSAQIK